MKSPLARDDSRGHGGHIRQNWAVGKRALARGIIEMTPTGW